MTSQTRRRHSPTSALAGTNLSRASDHNQRVVLQGIRAHGEITRSELSAITGLTHQSVINISRRLIEGGIVVDIGPTSGGRGHPAARLSINPNGAFALGLNIDRDHMTLVLMDLAGRMRERIHADAHFALPGDVIAFVCEGVDTMVSRRAVSKDRLMGLGVAIPERLHGVLVEERPDAYGQWASANIVDLLSEALRLPVYSENDATSAAIGELQFGKGLRYRNFIYTLISAGIGCGLIINGQPYTGGLAHAGEIGNLPIITAKGERKTLWDIVSLFTLYDELKDFGVAVSQPEHIMADGGAMEAGVDRWVKRAADCMLLPFLTFNYLLTPEAHFIGGQLPPFVVEKLCAELNSRLPAYQHYVPLTNFEPSTTSVNAASLGAAVLVLQNQLLPTPKALELNGKPS